MCKAFLTFLCTVGFMPSLNGDGFGVGWFPRCSSKLGSISVEEGGGGKVVLHDTPKESRHPCIFTGITPGTKWRWLLSLLLFFYSVLGYIFAYIKMDITLLASFSDTPLFCTISLLLSNIRALFLSAWNNINLHRLSEHIESSLIFAHVRAATPGRFFSVMERMSSMRFKQQT